MFAAADSALYESSLARVPVGEVDPFLANLHPHRRFFADFYEKFQYPHSRKF
jgi:hypothetical protein